MMSNESVLSISEFKDLSLGRYANLNSRLSEMIMKLDSVRSRIFPTGILVDEFKEPTQKLREKFTTIATTRKLLEDVIWTHISFGSIGTIEMFIEVMLQWSFELITEARMRNDNPLAIEICHHYSDLVLKVMDIFMNTYMASTTDMEVFITCMRSKKEAIFKDYPYSDPESVLLPRTRESRSCVNKEVDMIESAMRDGNDKLRELFDRHIKYIMNIRCYPHQLTEFILGKIEDVVLVNGEVLSEPMRWKDSGPANYVPITNMDLNNDKVGSASNNKMYNDISWNLIDMYGFMKNYVIYVDPDLMDAVHVKNNMKDPGAVSSRARNFTELIGSI